ncbi:unnamed protein product [Schistocephalus solidus]|uniref:HECT domain-containing protein n=1 Tax=Schistocephalus solidus TaxID=70667 RepID=A0A183SKG6_SCHSO|nr:unnamed protein product [Schistocephalus solidus]
MILSGGHGESCPELAKKIKGLSSANLGEQCKAIAEFPTLILKYPFPMVINSIFLKISELFREGFFGLLCRIFQHNVSVHHIVMAKLESHYEVELDAALWTAHELISISNKLPPKSVECIASTTSGSSIWCGRSGLRHYLDSNVVYSISKRLCKLFGSSSCISEKEEILAIFFKLTESCNFVDLLLHLDETSTEDDGSPGCVASCVQWVALEYTQSPAHFNSALVPRALSLACKLAVLIHLRGGDIKLTSGWNSIFQSDSVSDFIAQTMSSRKAVKVEDQDSQDDEPWFLSTTGPPLMELKHMYVNLLRFFRVFPKFAVVLRSVGLFEEVVLRKSLEDRIWERAQVAGAAGAAPGRTTTPGSDPTEWECHKGHIKKEPLQPDSQSASQPLYTKHIGLTTRSELSRHLSTFQATAFSAP